jgi:hypothetical protein
MYVRQNGTQFNRDNVMFSVIKKFIRDDVATLFYFECHEPSDNYKLHVKTKYRDTNKLISVGTSMSEDLKVFTATMVFNTKDDFLDFMLDDTLYMEHNRNNHLYNLKNNIRIETSLG